MNFSAHLYHRATAYLKKHLAVQKVTPQTYIRPENFEYRGTCYILRDNK